MDRLHFIVIAIFILVSVFVTYLSTNKIVSLRKRRDALTSGLANVLRYMNDIPLEYQTPRLKGACDQAAKLVCLKAILKDKK